jgi:hypothetical protein
MSYPENHETLTDFNDVQEVSGERFLERVKNLGTRSLVKAQVAICTLEVTPLNEMLRVAAAGVFIAKFKDPVTVAALSGAAGLAIEAPAGLAAASLTGHERAQRFTSKANQKIEKLGVDNIVKANGASQKLAEGAVALVGGASISVFYKETIDPGQSLRSKRIYGMMSASAISASISGQAYAAAHGIEHFTPVNVGLGLAGIGALIATPQILLNRYRSEPAPVTEGE